MNYLAHAYLSFGHEEILVGNMISDFVKGSRQFSYPPMIRKGIVFHRAIDKFTDGHAATKEINKFFKPSVRLYAGAFTDVVYDHFLAADATHWASVPLRAFTSGVYEVLYRYFHLLPERFQQMVPYMRSQDWLFNYQFKWGAERSFGGVARRAVYLNNAVAAFDAFEKHYDDLCQLSQPFIADVKKFASNEFELLLRD